MSNLILEHKSTSEEIGPGSLWWKRLTLDPQTSVYIDAARAGGIDTNEILFDVLRKPQHKQAKGDTSPDAFRNRVLGAILEAPEKYYQRGTIVRLEDEAIVAAGDLWQTAEQVRHAKNTNRWPRNPDSCTQYFRTCDYWGACAGEQSIDDPLLFELSEPHEELSAEKRKLPLLTQSSTRSYRACPKRYYFRYVAGIRPRTAATSLNVGRSLHKSLEVWWKRGGDLEAAIAALGTDGDPWGLAKRQAMIAGYHARYLDDLPRWEVVAVEKEFIVDLINPDTGAKSRTFQIGGKVDVLVRKKAA